MFHTIVIDKNSHLVSIHLKPSDFLCLHVRRVCITFDAISMARASEFLSTCASIVDLAFWLAWPRENEYSVHISRSVLPKDKIPRARVLSELLALRRVELPHEQLVEIERAGILPRWCMSLTHLWILYWTASSKDQHIDVPFLQDMVSLTHLHIHWQRYEIEIHEKIDVVSFLQARPLLHMVLIGTGEGLIPDGHMPVDVRIVYRTKGDDPVGEWRDQGSVAGKWAVAEEEIARRRGRDEARQDGGG
jgi:hypothetical protein